MQESEIRSEEMCCTPVQWRDLTMANTLLSKPSTSLSLMPSFGWYNYNFVNHKHSCCIPHKLAEGIKPGWLEATQNPSPRQAASQVIWQNRTIKSSSFLSICLKAKCKLTYDLCCPPSFYSHSSYSVLAPFSSHSTLTPGTSHLKSSENWICLLRVSHERAG